MKFKLLVFVLIACNVFFSCAINKGLKDTKYTHGKEQYSPKFSWPYIKEKKIHCTISVPVIVKISLMHIK